MDDFTIVNLQDLTEATNLTVDDLLAIGQGSNALTKATIQQVGVFLGVSSSVVVGDKDIEPTIPSFAFAEAGLYPEWGNIEIIGNLGILIFDGTNFSKTEINFIANGVVEEGNTQAVSGGEVYDKITEVENVFDGFRNDITIESSNLVDKSKITKGYYSATNDYAGNNNDFICIELNVSPSTTYTLYGHGILPGSLARLLYLTEDNTLISNVLSTGNSEEVTFTTPSNCDRLRINIATGTNIGLNPTENLFANNLQLNEGSIVLPYEEFGLYIDSKKLDNYNELVLTDNLNDLVDFNNNSITNLYYFKKRAKIIISPNASRSKINDDLVINGALQFSEDIPLTGYSGKKLYVKFNGSSVTNAFTVSVIQKNGSTTISTHSITNLDNEIDFIVDPNTTLLTLTSNSTSASNILTVKDWYISEQPYNNRKVLKSIIDEDRIKLEGVLNVFKHSNFLPLSNQDLSIVDGQLHIPTEGNAVYELDLSDIENKSKLTLYFDVLVQENFNLRIIRQLIGATNTAVSYYFITNRNTEDSVIWTDDYTEYDKVVFTIFNDGIEEDVIISNMIVTPDIAIRGVKGKVESDNTTTGGFKTYNSLHEAVINNEVGYFAVGKQIFKAKTQNVINSFDYEIVGDSRMPRNRRLENVVYIDTGNLTFKYIDTDYMMYFTDTAGNKTYKISKEDFDSNLTTPILKTQGTFHSDGVTLLQEDEYHSSIDISNFTLIFNQNITGVREMGNGELFFLAYTTSIYTTENKTVYNTIDTPVVIGNLIDAWLFDVYDNIVVFGGYFTAGHGQGDDTRGHGRLVISTDYGKTFKTIFDADLTDLEIGDLFHIHGCCYDPYWDRVWMVVGDSLVAQTPGKIYYCDNYNDISPSWTILPFNSWVGGREQYCTIYPHSDFLLLGTDMTPTALARMARVGKDVNAKRDIVFDIDDLQLTTVPSSFHQWDSDLPIAIFNGIQNNNLQNSLESCRASIFLTINGNDVYEVWKDYVKSSANDTYNVIRYLPTHEIYTSKRDVRFSSGNTMIYGKMSKWI